VPAPQLKRIPLDGGRRHRVTPQQFVRALKATVHDSAIHNALDQLERPSGRKPAQRVVELSQWYHSLSQHDRSQLRQVVSLAVHRAVFGVLSVLDGVRALDSGAAEARLELHAAESTQRTRLNGSSGPMLHDLYQDAVYPEVFGEAAV